MKIKLKRNNQLDIYFYRCWKLPFLQYSNIFIARRIYEVLLVHCSLFIRIKTTFLRPTINWNYILIEYFSVGKLKELKIKRFKENFFKVSNKDVRNTFCVSWRLNIKNIKNNKNKNIKPTLVEVQRERRQ